MIYSVKMLLLFNMSLVIFPGEITYFLCKRKIIQSFCCYVYSRSFVVGKCSPRALNFFAARWGEMLKRRKAVGAASDLMDPDGILASNLTEVS